MPLLNIVIVLVVVGVALHLINRFIPMASSIKSILNVVVVVFVCIWLLQATGLWGDLSDSASDTDPHGPIPASCRRGRVDRVRSLRLTIPSDFDITITTIPQRRGTEL